MQVNTLGILQSTTPRPPQKDRVETKGSTPRPPPKGEDDRAYEMTILNSVDDFASLLICGISFKNSESNYQARASSPFGGGRGVVLFAL